MITRGRLSASEIQAYSPTRKETAIQASADNTPIRILYGEKSVAGDVFAYGLDGTDLVVGVAWCYGEIESVVRCYINDDELPITNVAVTHYTGTTWQTADADLVAAIAAYSDTMVLETPNNDVGIAYSVFRIDAGAITGAPRFHAVIKAAKVDDPRPASDPLESDTELWAVFDEAVPVDQSSNARTVTLGTGVTVSDGVATNSATNQGVTFSGSFAFGTQDFCIEAKVKILDPFGAGLFDIYRGNYALDTDSIVIRVNGDKIEIVVHDGAAIEFYESNAATIPASVTEFDVAFTRVSGTFYLWLDGIEVWSNTAAANINTTTSSNRTCFSESNPPRLNAVRSLRITLGDGRYTARHSVRGFPFPDCRRYSPNSALCWGDLATHKVYGMGAEVSGLGAAADWNDTLINGSVERCKLSLAISRSSKTLQYLDLLATYAELIYYWDGSKLTAIPDSAVDTGSVDTEGNCVAGSLSVEGVDDDDTPSRVYTRYTTIDLNSGHWPEAIISQSLAGVDEGDVSLLESTLTLPGITRVEEAANKAASRVERMRNRVRVSWVTTDKGIQWRTGTVVRHLMPHRGTDLYVRIVDVSMVGYGRYRVSGMRYDAAHYPSEVEVPETTGTIPVGAILPLSGDTVPAGWAAYTDANGRYIVGAGDTYTEGDTGGASSFAGFMGSTSSVDTHGSNPSYSKFNGFYRPKGGNFTRYREPDSYSSVPHSHTFSTGSFTPDLFRREARLVIKTGSAEASIPRAVQMFGLANIQLSGLTRAVSESNRLVMASASNASAGTGGQFISLTTGATNDSHDHIDAGYGADDDELAIADLWAFHESGGGSHAHFFSLAVAANIKASNVPLWTSVSDYEIIPGMIVLWEGGTLPTDWVLCDGSTPTPDLRNYFIKIAPDGGEFDTAGDNTLALSGTGSPVGHSHDGDYTLSGQERRLYNHSNEIFHTHTISESGAYTPPYYALSAIMYAP